MIAKLDSNDDGGDDDNHDDDDDKAGYNDDDNDDYILRFQGGAWRRAALPDSWSGLMGNRILQCHHHHVLSL